MVRRLAGVAVVFSLVLPLSARAQGAPKPAAAPKPAPSAKAAQVDMELMTHAEIYEAIHGLGKTTVLVFNGGTEQRGPHDVLGGHTFIARRTAITMARELGNALVAPVNPFAPAGGHLNANTPGSVDLPMPAFLAVNEAIVNSMVVNGFTNIVLMGDHGGGQKEMGELATRLDQKFGEKGVHVYWSGDVYEKSQTEFDNWAKGRGLPLGSHAGVRDTSVLMFLGGDEYVRKDRLAPGDGKNGVNGDPRPSTPEIGQVYFDIKVMNGVQQIRALIAAKTGKK